MEGENRNSESQQPQDDLSQLADAVKASEEHVHRPAQSGSVYEAGATVTGVPPRPSGNLVMSAIGACLGAAVGAGIWFGIAYVTRFEIGYVAILVGALAGWGAVLVGKARSPAVGTIAAIAGAAAIVIGSYANFHATFRSEEARSEARRIFDEEVAADDPEYAALTPQEKQEVFDQWYEEEVLPNISYFDYMKEEPGDIFFLLLFGLIGLYYGFRVGGGVTRKA